MCVIGIVREPRPTLGAQSRTLRITQRVVRQCEHHRVPQDGLEVEQFVLEGQFVLARVVVLVALFAMLAVVLVAPLVR